MSYLMLTNGVQNLDSAIISFWFRIPQASVDAAKETYQPKRDEQGNYPTFNGVIPLVVIGPAGSRVNAKETSSPGPPISQHYASGISGGEPITSHIMGTWQEREPGPVAGSTWMVTHVLWQDRWSDGTPYWQLVHTEPGFLTSTAPDGGPVDTDPTVIGVACGVDPDIPDTKPALYVNLQTGVKPSVSGLAWDTTAIVTQIIYDAPTTYGEYSHTYEMKYPFGIGNFVGDRGSTASMHTQPGGDSQPGDITHEDRSSVVYDETQNFTTVSSDMSNNQKMLVEPDHWHHVLVSFEINPCTVHGRDNGGDQPVAAYVDSSPRLWVALDDVNYTEQDLSPSWPDGSNDPNAILSDDAYGAAGTGAGPVGPVSFSCDCSELPGDPIGIPATEDFVQDIYRVEMAEFQMWVGQTLDPDDASNRRLFVDGDGKPTKTQAAEDQLGKPQIRLHGSGNWISGRNSGSQKSPEFEPTGKIIRYSPDPSLHGPQGDGTDGATTRRRGPWRVKKARPSAMISSS